jgi:tetratricopeptide (TPR) repeat protein
MFCFDLNNRDKGFVLLEKLSQKNNPEIYMVVGYLYLVYNRPVAAMKVLSKVLLDDDQNAQCYYLLAVAHDVMDEDLLCYKALRKALGCKKDFHEAYNYLGLKFLYGEEKIKEAEYLLEKALELDPNNEKYSKDLQQLKKIKV